MRCPFCGHLESQVKDSRPSEDGAAIRRRRLCPECGGRFTTFERVQLRELTIVKRSGRRAPFEVLLATEFTADDLGDGRVAVGEAGGEELVGNDGGLGGQGAAFRMGRRFGLCLLGWAGRSTHSGRIGRL